MHLLLTNLSKAEPKPKPKAKAKAEVVYIITMCAGPVPSRPVPCRKKYPQHQPAARFQPNFQGKPKSIIH